MIPKRLFQIWSSSAETAFLSALIQVPAASFIAGISFFVAKANIAKFLADAQRTE